MFWQQNFQKLLNNSAFDKSIKKSNAPIHTESTSPMKTMANCSHWSLPLPQPEISTNCCLQLPNTHLYVDWVSSSIKQSLWSNWYLENREYPKRLSTTSTTCSKNLGKSESLNTTCHPRDTHNQMGWQSGEYHLWSLSWRKQPSVTAILTWYSYALKLP